MDAASTAGGVLLATAWLGALATIGYAASTRIDPDASARQRLTQTMIGAGWMAAAIFLLLSALGAFDRLGVTSVLTLGLAVALRRDRPALVARARDDLGEATAAWRTLVGPRALRSPWLGAAIVAFAALELRFLRGLLKPPTATDSLTYHLFRAGRFVQEGGWVVEPTPDAGGYYAYYPPLGDGYWAWTLLPVHGDALVALTAAGTTFAVALAFYLAARELGAELRPAAWAALALVATPAVSAWCAIAYVDGMLLTATLLAAAAMPRALTDPRPRSVVWVLGALGLAVGIKTPGVVPMAMGVLVLAVAVVRRSPRPIPTFGAGLLASAVALPGLVLGILDHGNPLYPFGFEPLGWVANPEVGALQRGEFLPDEMRTFDVLHFLRVLVVPNPNPGIQHMNFGPAAVLVLPFALAGRKWWASDAGSRGAALFGGLVLLVFVVQLGSESNLGVRIEAASAMGRFLAIPFAVILLAASRSSSRWLRPALGTMVLVGSWYGLPAALGPADLDALTGAAPILGIAALSIVGLSLALRSGHLSPGRTTLGLSATVVIAIVALALQRPGLRERYYQQLHAGELFDPHPTDPRATAAWPIWSWVEQQPDGLRIAFAAGWDRMGHNWYRAPLMGSRLQHEVVYVSPTASGELIDYRLDAELRAAADPEAWVRRLLEREVDVVVLGVPQSVEHAWVLQAPHLFRPVVRGDRGWVIAFALQAPP